MAGDNLRAIMALGVQIKGNALRHVALWCIASTTFLTPVAAAAAIDAPSSENRYQQRRDAIAASETPLPSADLLLNPQRRAPVKAASETLRKAEIPAKKELVSGAATTAPADTTTASQAAEAASAPQEPAAPPSAPLLVASDERPAQSVQAFTPLPWLVSSSDDKKAESLASLSPSAEAETPLIALPDLSSETTEKPAAEPPAHAATSLATLSATATTTATVTNASEQTTPPQPAAPAIPTANAPSDPAIQAGTGSAPPVATTPLIEKIDIAPVSATEGEKPPHAEAPAAEQPVAQAAAKPYSPMDSEPASNLSRESSRIAERIPSNLDTPSAPSAQDITIERGRSLNDVSSPSLDTEDQKPPQSVHHESAGMDIKVNQPNRNLDHELAKAYDALATGQTSMALDLYKNILSNDPQNKGALFGLATTYHRTGQLDQARLFYGKLLAIDPTHRDGLNNFLVLLADEAPQQALEKMEALAKRNPNFSPIPAQMAVIYQRLGNPDQALAHMFRAVALAPENLVYRYNLAILLDKQKKYDEAARLYQQLIEAAGRGIVIPGNLQKIQQRLTFISSNRQ